MQVITFHLTGEERAYGRLVSVVDLRVFCACARGERFLGVINIIEGLLEVKTSSSGPAVS